MTRRDLSQVADLDMPDPADPIEQAGAEFLKVVPIGRGQTYPGDDNPIICFDDSVPLNNVSRLYN